MPRISLAYTSRRAERIEQVIDLWRSRAGDLKSSGISLEVALGIDSDYIAGLGVASRLVEAGKADRLAINSKRPDCVSGWNAAASECTGDILIAVADDFNPPTDWATRLVAVEKDWWLKDRIVWVYDGYNPDIHTLTIWSRSRYERFGYLFYPGYQSLFSDTENTTVATLERAVIDARRLLTFEHMHPDCGKRSRDAIDLHHASTARWKSGELLYDYRKSVGFPIDDGPKAHTYDPDEEIDYVLYVQAIKDDIGLYEICNRIVDEGVRTMLSTVSAVYLCVPDEYWAGAQTSPQDRAEVVAAATRLKETWPHVGVHVIDVPVAPHRAPGRPRIDVETEVRNSSLEAVRKHSGKQHILIADGDELWRRWLLAELSEMVRERRPAGVFTGMVPSIGLPGYAIHNAKDKASIYVGAGAFFTDCRGTSGFRHDLPGHKIIHFTATRPTMEQIVDKSRNSGHFDDRTYAFEPWLANTLPNVKPGMKNAHMWTAGENVWPEVRKWTREEWDEIPEALRRYLAAP